MAQNHEQMARRYMEEVMNQGKLDVIDEICADRFRAHDPMFGETDRKGQREQAQMLRQAFPDIRITIEDTCVSSDMVALRWTSRGTHRGSLMGMEPTGRSATIQGMTMVRFQNGKAVEDWTMWDTAGLLEQLGMIRSPMEMMRAGGGAEARP
jgi:steroid delta-isomerase-like uncharacterized protein